MVRHACNHVRHSCVSIYPIDSSVVSKVKTAQKSALPISMLCTLCESIGM